MARVSFCSKADLGMLLQRRVSLLARAYSLPAYFYGSEIPYGGKTVNIHPPPTITVIIKEMIHLYSLIFHTVVCESKIKEKRTFFFKKSTNINNYILLPLKDEQSVGNFYYSIFSEYIYDIFLIPSTNDFK